MMNEYRDGKVNWSVNRVVIQTLFMINDYSDGKVNPFSLFSLEVSTVSNIKHFIIHYLNRFHDNCTDQHRAEI